MDVPGGILDRIRCRLRDQDGSAIVEYGIMVALISAMLVVTVGLLGGEPETVLSVLTGDLGNEATTSQ